MSLPSPFLDHRGTESTLGWVIFGTLIFSIFLLWNGFQAKTSHGRSFWAHRPSVGWRKQWFSDARATWRSTVEAQAIIAHGYVQYSKSNVPFAIPSIASGTSIVIPPSHIKNVFCRSDRELSAIEAQRDVIQARYTITDQDIYVNEFHFDVIRKRLTKSPVLPSIVAEELPLAFERYWGTSSGWSSVKALDTVLHIVARTVNRGFIGLPACRNESFLEHSIKYSESVFGGGIVINLAPRFLRQFIGPLVGLAAKWHLAACKRICAPAVKERLMKEERRRTNQKFDWNPPDDVLQWVIEECYATGDLKQLKTGRIIHRLLMFNLVAIHAISLTTTEAILDLHSSSMSSDFVDRLREESDRVLRQFNGRWSLDSLSKLHRLDSTIRESLRFSNFGVTALSRQVTAPDGILLGDQARIPAGVRICVPMHEIHHDSAFYSKPRTFDPFRFSRSFEENDVTGATKTGSKSAPQPATAGSNSFLAFGYGRHMCPGRFFAVNEMKLMLTSMLKNYDVQYMAERPARQTVMENMVPFQSTTIKVRRRART